MIIKAIINVGRNTGIAILYLLSLLACGNNPNGLPETDTRAENYTCGVITDNEVCIALQNSDSYSDERHFILNVPDELTEQPPLFIVLHGSGGRADKTVERFDFREFVAQNGFIGAFPNSIVRNDGISTWNAHDPTYAVSFVDDVGFIQKLIEEVIRRHNIDPQRVFIFGWSNGGFMANRLACELPQSISAIFTLAGNLRSTLDICSELGQVAVHHLHATGDSIVPFYGDANKGYISAQEAIERWAEYNQCEQSPASFGPFDLTFDVPNDDSNSYRYLECETPVELTVIEGSDHGPDFNLANFHLFMIDYFDRTNAY